jgi:trans-2,3-dihydro-3-hydroxyanthranilate isomerase
MLSAGNPFLFAPLRNADALARARVDSTSWRALMDGVHASGVYMFCPVGPAGSRRIRARLFAPDHGIAENPATGSAAAALPADLVPRHRLADGLHPWTIEQGIEIGRPSEIAIEITAANGSATTVRVGGSAVIVAEGTMEVPVAH